MNRINTNNTIYIPKGNSFYKVMLSDIQYVKAEKGCIIIQTNQRKYVLSSTLKRFAEQVSDSNFLFIHRSYYVNTTYISNFEKDKISLEGETLPMSLSGYKLLLKKIVRIKAK